MDYKKEIIEMIDKINDDSLLEFFYRFVGPMSRFSTS